MQIHRIDNFSVPGPTRSFDTTGVQSKSGVSGSVVRENEAEGVLGGNELNRLIRQLDDVSGIRPEVVAAAKVRVQRGDYLTRAAAEQTAAGILSKDA
jgi:hypothetical protein